MANVVNIKRSTDSDLLEQFQLACPDVPANLNDIIGSAATRALGHTRVDKSGLSIKTVCLFVAGACVLGATIVHGVTTRWQNAVESVASRTPENTALQIAAALPDSGSAESWRRSQSAWAAYIQHLENDAFYQYVLEEKRRYQQRFPD